MADVQAGDVSFTINAASNYTIGDASDNVVGTLLIQGTPTSFVGTGLVIKARAHGSGQAWMPIPYVRRSLNAVASDDTVVSAVLTTSFVIKVDASGCDVSIDNSTGYTSGSFAIRVCRVDGAAA